MNIERNPSIPKGSEGIASQSATSVLAVKNKVNRVFTPYGSLEQLRGSPIFMGFLGETMRNLQKEGSNFMDALMEVAKRWNNGPHALSQGFRMTTNIAPTKSHRISGRLVQVQNEIHLKKVLGIDDYKTESICRALGVSPREIWPEVIRGKNQYSKGNMHPSIRSGKNQYSTRLSSLIDYKKWWKNGGSERYRELRKEKYSPRDAIRQAGQEYNQQQESDNTRLNITELCKVYRELIRAK